MLLTLHGLQTLIIFQLEGLDHYTTQHVVRRPKPSMNVCIMSIRHVRAIVRRAPQRTISLKGLFSWLQTRRRQRANTEDTDCKDPYINYMNEWQASFKYTIQLTCRLTCLGFTAPRIRKAVSHLEITLSERNSTLRILCLHCHSKTAPLCR